MTVKRIEPMRGSFQKPRLRTTMTLPQNVIAVGQFAAAIVAICVTGCSGRLIESDVTIESLQTNSTKQEVAEETATTDPPMAMPNATDIVFKDQVESNIEIPEGLDGLVFLDTKGKRVSLKSYLGEKNVVLVFTEGFAGGMLCPFCKTQTSRLVANYDKFANLDTEILVVYPGSRDHLDEFVAAAKKSEKAEVDSVPFPLVLDEDLAAVGYFNIASNLAHPSTFIIDKRGNVQLAYVGADMTADRPSVAAMLRVIESANVAQ